MLSCAKPVAQQKLSKKVFSSGYWRKLLMIGPGLKHSIMYLCSVSSLIHICFFSGLGISGQRWFSQQPLLAMAIRGPYAQAVWQEITGPSDPMLVRKTDPASINTLHCQEHTQFHSPRLASLLHLSLCVWFGGRPTNNDHRMTTQ